ncbi:winged helix-turn-helix domain-containing protein [Deinococcus sp.]|uniref:winged helix-turn-helix domain-containing protein n=1 Tax=Deinococcus sp. TaxID=47478 RepID=UPI0025BA4716|nr:winged helix-turn-helix domain-containing protein [Deinococcus sp.]
MTVEFKHAPQDFWDIYRRSTCAVERRRAQFLALLAEGRPEAEVFDLTRYSVNPARLTVRRYHELGLAGLRDGRHDNQGAPTILTATEQQRLAAQLQEDFGQGVLWDGKKVQQWVKQEFGKEVFLSRAYEWLNAAGFSKQKARARPTGSSDEASEAVKTKS